MWDNIIRVIALICGVCVIALIAKFLNQCNIYEFSELPPADKNIAIVTPCKKLFIINIVLLIFWITVPSSKQMAAMIMIPKIINNESIQNIGNNTLDSFNKLSNLSSAWIESKAKELNRETKNE
jgi:hypothetical protein